MSPLIPLSLNSFLNQLSQKSESDSHLCAHVLTFYSILFFLERGLRDSQTQKIHSLSAIQKSWQSFVEQNLKTYVFDNAFRSFCNRHTPIAKELNTLEMSAFLNDEMQSKHTEILAEWKNEFKFFKEFWTVFSSLPESRLTMHIFRIFSGHVTTQIEWQKEVFFLDKSVETQLKILQEAPFFALNEVL